MTRRCPRCGLEFVVTEVHDRYCFTCTGEVMRLIAADERRRRPRFPAKDMTGAVA